MLVKDQFFEMSFGLEYDGKKIGVGSIVWLYVVEGTGAGSVAYE